jgi:hypothetical protein
MGGRSGCTKAKRRTVELHERVERPDLGVVILPVSIGSTYRQGCEVSSVPEFWIFSDLGSPLPRRKGEQLINRKKRKGHESTYAANAEVVSPDLAIRRALQ